MLGNSVTSWGVMARVIHASAALLILVLLGHGWWMVEFPPREVRVFHYSWHASFGYALLALTVFRLVWRWLNAVPAAPAGSAKWEVALAHIGHWGLYLLMLAAAILGWGLAGTFGAPLDAQLLGFIPMPAIASNTNPELHGQLESLHALASWTLAALVVVHVLAALYHQYYKRDGVLKRMF